MNFGRGSIRRSGRWNSWRIKSQWDEKTLIFFLLAQGLPSIFWAALKRIPQLDGLRAMALIMVFSSHVFSLPIWVGLDLFFVLSGYLITKILLRSKANPALGYWKPFYLRRAQRILPPYVVFLLVAYFILHLPWVRSWYWYVFFSANIAMALHQAERGPLAPLWSLALEEQFYLLWPALIYFCRPRSVRWITLSLVFLCPFLRTLAAPYFQDNLPINSLLPFRLDVLAFGGLVAVCEEEEPNWVARHRRPAFWIFSLVGISCCSLALVPALHSVLRMLFPGIIYSLSALLSASLLICALNLQKNFFHAVLTWRPVTYLAEISYTFYLYHVTVLLFVHRYVERRIWLALIAFAITTAWAALSWRFFEGPILGMRLESGRKIRVATG